MKMKMEIPCNKTDQEPPFHNSIELVCCKEVIEIFKIQNLFKDL